MNAFPTPPQPPSDPTSDPHAGLDAGQVATLVAHVLPLVQRLHRARAAAARAESAMDRAIAEAVTSRPDSVRWFSPEHAGTVTIAQAAHVLGMTPNAIIGAVERHRRRSSGRAVRRRK